MHRLVDQTFHAPADIAAARAVICAAVEHAGLDGTRLQDVAVAATELMTNALVHTATADPQVCVEQVGADVVVSVLDTDHTAPEIRPVDPTRVGGNGLRLVDALSDRWGTDLHDDDGKTVWFAIALAPRV